MAIKLLNKSSKERKAPEEAGAPEAPQEEKLTPARKAVLEDKLKILEELGQPELIDIFNEWKPRPVRRRQAAPLDQRVSITVTDSERVLLDNELKAIKASGEKTSASQFIRNRAMGSVDIHGWRAVAVEALRELDDLTKEQNTLRRRRTEVMGLLETEEDQEEVGLLEMELSSLTIRLGKLLAKNEKRTNRLTGRMSMVEAETVKWRAQKLCLSTSDYLRFMIFDLAPNSSADAHLSLDARRRFYVSVIEVADSPEGFGSPPNVFQCSQCGNYLEEIERLRDRLKQLEVYL